MLYISKNAGIHQNVGHFGPIPNGFPGVGDAPFLICTIRGYAKAHEHIAHHGGIALAYCDVIDTLEFLMS